MTLDPRAMSEREDANPPMTDGDDPVTLWWCKRRDGVIVEHEARSTSGHSGHVRCVEVGAP